MSKLSGWKIVCLAVASVAMSLWAASVVRADSFSDQAAKLDIVGVHLGMTPAEAKSALAQHRKDNMQWREVKGDLSISEGPYLARANAQWNESTTVGYETAFVVYSTPPRDPKVLGVARSVKFNPPQAPTAENLVNSLTDKFGQPSAKYQARPGSLAFVWAWDKSGQISKPNQPNICAVDELKLTFILENDSYMSGWMSNQVNNAGCAIAVLALINYDNNRIANELEMGLVDKLDALQSAIATDNHVKQVKRAQAEAALKKASANKPPIL